MALVLRVSLGAVVSALVASSQGFCYGAVGSSQDAVCSVCSRCRQLLAVLLGFGHVLGRPPTASERGDALVAIDLFFNLNSALAWQPST